MMAPVKSNRTFSEGAKSKGILDDYAVRKDVATLGGTVEKVPVNDNDIANKKYVDDNVGGVDWTADQSPLAIHTANYVDNDTTYISSDFDHNSLANAHNLTTDIDHNIITNNHNLTTDIDHNTILNNHNLTTDIDHDQLTNFTVNEHLDWTADLGAVNIHAGNYTDTDTTYISSDFDHDQLTNFVVNEHLDWTADLGAVNINSANYTDTTYVSSDFTHDDLTGFVANEHIDWTADQGATNIHAGNYTDTDTTTHSSFSQLDYASAGHTGFAPALGADDNYVTDAEKAALHAESHTIVSHSDTTATGAELNTLTGGGDTTLHDHDGISENTTARHTQNTDTALGSGAVAADHGTAATDQIINVCYGTGSAPTANTTTIGSLFVKYTA